jgi:antirestriction protein ArdC
MRRNVARERRRTTHPAAFLHITDTSRLLEVLKNDKRAIFSAAAHAQKAADYLARLQPGTTEQAAA